MKIATKINLLTTTWLVFILLLMNVFVFFTFMKAITKLEERDLIKTGESLMHRTSGNLDMLSKLPLHAQLRDHSLIRVISSEETIVNEASNDKALKQIRPTFTAKESSHLTQIGEKQVIIVRLPITSAGRTVGTLEIGQYLAGLEKQKDIVLTILASCSAAAILLSLLGGRWLSKIIIRPVSSMITTMKDIEQSGVPKTILVHAHTKDELQTMAVTFNRMIQRLQNHMDRQRQFVSDASHELKTPLTIIRSYADLLTRRGLKDEQLAMEAIESIRLESIRLQGMTESLLDLALSEQKSSQHLEQVELIALCKPLLKQMNDTYKRDFELTHQQATIYIEADKQKIKQVILILLDNAVKYSKERIIVQLSQTADEATLTVKDYGIGIPQEHIQHIFDRFYRVDQARSRETGGTGLGMAIALNIMKQHNGRISIRSELGSGTEATLHFPSVPNLNQQDA